MSLLTFSTAKICPFDSFSCQKFGASVFFHESIFTSGQSKIYPPLAYFLRVDIMQFLYFPSSFAGRSSTGSRMRQLTTASPGTISQSFLRLASISTPFHLAATAFYRHDFTVILASASGTLPASLRRRNHYQTSASPADHRCRESHRRRMRNRRQADRRLPSPSGMCVDIAADRPSTTIHHAGKEPL